MYNYKLFVIPKVLSFLLTDNLEGIMELNNDMALKMFWLSSIVSGDL